MLATMELQVSFRGKTLLVKGVVSATMIASVKEKLEEITAVPVANQKLILKGKALRVDADTLEATGVVSAAAARERGGEENGEGTFVQTSRLMLVGSRPSEVEEVLKGRDMVTVRNDLNGVVVPKGYKKVALNYPAGPSEFSPYRFQRIETLPGLPEEETARNILESLAADPGVRAVLEKHQWTVGALCELYPEGKVGVSDTCVMGLNQNKGMKILLRLRTDDLRGFRKILSIRKVLFHELAHNDISDHDDKFYMLMRQVEQEAAELNWMQQPGRTVAGRPPGPRAEPAGLPGNGGGFLLVKEAFEGGSGRLGGDSNALTHLFSARELAGQAAVERLTPEEQEVEDCCGHTKKNRDAAAAATAATPAAAAAAAGPTVEVAAEEAAGAAAAGSSTALTGDEAGVQRGLPRQEEEEKEEEEGGEGVRVTVRGGEVVVVEAGDGEAGSVARSNQQQSSEIASLVSGMSTLSDMDVGGDVSESVGGGGGDDGREIPLASAELSIETDRGGRGVKEDGRGERRNSEAAGGIKAEPLEDMVVEQAEEDGTVSSTAVPQPILEPPGRDHAAAAAAVAASTAAVQNGDHDDDNESAYRSGGRAGAIDLTTEDRESPAMPPQEPAPPTPRTQPSPPTRTSPTLPTPASTPTPTPPPPRASPPALDELLAMGFPREAAMEALVASGGSIPDAAYRLLTPSFSADGTPPGSDESATEAVNGGRAGGGGRGGGGGVSREGPRLSRDVRLQEAANRIAEHVDRVTAVQCLDVLAGVFRNLMEHPEEAKFRRVRRSNGKFKASVGSVPGGVEVLLAAGFEERGANQLELGRQDPGLIWLAKSTVEACQERLSDVRA